MSLEQVGRLEELLERIQNNRAQPRVHPSVVADAPAMARPAAPAANVAVTSAALPGSANPTPLATPTAAAIAASRTAGPSFGSPNRVERERATFTEEHVHVPDLANMRPAPARPGAAASSPAMGRDSSTSAAAMGAQSRRRERTSTPLEMAVEGELHRGTPVDLGTPADVTPSRHTSITEPAMAAAAAANARPTPSDGLEMPRTFEPEPLREAVRPIAQVVSKHAPQVDATFGAMLKRSLSLRPR